MSRILSKEECLQLDIGLYNTAMELQWKEDKVKKNLSGNLINCEHCGRKYVICCICDEAAKRWDDMITEVQAVSERNRSDEF
jgi:hypothetical protein